MLAYLYYFYCAILLYRAVIFYFFVTSHFIGRLSKASTTASRMSNRSRASQEPASVAAGRVHGRQPFKP